MTILRLALVATAICGVCSWSALADGPAANSNGPVVKRQELHPFTHFASISEGSDLRSIHFESVKLVMIPTASKSEIDVHGCEEAANRAPGGSIQCSYTQFQSPSPAYEVTYSYSGLPMASDESGSRHFTFSVYLRPDELSPAAQQALSENRTNNGTAGFFRVNTSRDLTRHDLIDQAASTFCNGNFVDGLWTHTDSKCAYKIHYKTVEAPSNFVTVRVDPATPAPGISAAK